MTTFYTNMNTRDLIRSHMIDDVIHCENVDYDDENLICLSTTDGEDFYFYTNDISVLEWLKDNDKIYRRSKNF